jgi:hypothetical protein
MSDAWMKNLGFDLSHDWRVSLHTRAPFEHNFVSIVLSRARGVYALKGAVMDPQAFLAAYHDRPVILSEGHVAEAILPDEIGRTLEQSLREVGVEALPHKPLTGTDGLSITVDVWSESGAHRFEAWSPEGHQRDVLRLLLGPLMGYLAGLARMPAVRKIEDWLKRSYGVPMEPRPFRARSGEIVLACPHRDASQSWSMRIDEDGLVRAEGAGFATRAWALNKAIRDRVLHALDLDRLFGLGARLGLGPHELVLSVASQAMTVQLNTLTDGSADFSSMPRAAASLGVLLSLRDEMMRARPESAGLALPTLPDLPRPVRVEGLLLRFRTHEPRVWWSVFERGVCQGFVDGDAAIAGSPLPPRVVPPDTMHKLRALVLGLELRVVDIGGGENDVEVTLQRAVGRSLAFGRYRWTPSHHRSPARDPAFHPGEFDRIYAIYTLIEPLGAVWS